MPDNLGMFREMVTGSVQYARAVERIGACAPLLSGLSDSLNRIIELEPDLAPEIAVVAQHLCEVQEALTRSMTFLEARYEVGMAKLLEPEDG